MGLSGIVCENELFSSARRKKKKKKRLRKEKVLWVKGLKNTNLILCVFQWNDTGEETKTKEKKRVKRQHTVSTVLDESCRSFFFLVRSNQKWVWKVSNEKLRWHHFVKWLSSGKLVWISLFFLCALISSFASYWFNNLLSIWQCRHLPYKNTTLVLFFSASLTQNWTEDQVEPSDWSTDTYRFVRRKLFLFVCAHISRVKRCKQWKLSFLHPTSKMLLSWFYFEFLCVSLFSRQITTELCWLISKISITKTELAKGNDAHTHTNTDTILSHLLETYAHKGFVCLHDKMSIVPNVRISKMDYKTVNVFII